MYPSSITLSVQGSNHVFRFRSQSSDGAGVFHDITGNVAYDLAPKLLSNFKAPGNDSQGKFRISGGLRYPAAVTRNGTVSVKVANVDIGVSIPVEFDESQRNALKAYAVAMIDNAFVGNAIANLTVPGAPGDPQSSSS